ncbi:uncharacterized, partial [Tachysurus ichikawai]
TLSGTVELQDMLLCNSSRVRALVEFEAPLQQRSFSLYDCAMIKPLSRLIYILKWLSFDYSECVASVEHSEWIKTGWDGKINPGLSENVKYLKTEEGRDEKNK